MNKSLYNFPITHIACPVERITGVWEFKRPPFFKYVCYSLPGHLLHLVTKGSYNVKISGRKYHIKAGDVIYYHESEEVETIGNDNEVTFYSVGFHAPKLQPLPLELRVFYSDKDMLKLFHKLYEGFSIDNLQTRSYKTYSTLLTILNNIESLYSNSRNDIREKEELWRELERRIRKNKIFRTTFEELCNIAGYSKSTIIRSCKRVTGITPMQRIQKLRMEEAKGLLSVAQLNISQVANYLGYPRIHEFSREFSKYYGKPPSALLQL